MQIHKENYMWNLHQLCSKISIYGKVKVEYHPRELKTLQKTLKSLKWVVCISNKFLTLKTLKWVSGIRSLEIFIFSPTL